MKDNKQNSFNTKKFPTAEAVEKLKNIQDQIRDHCCDGGLYVFCDFFAKKLKPEITVPEYYKLYTKTCNDFAIKKIYQKDCPDFKKVPTSTLCRHVFLPYYIYLVAKKVFPREFSQELILYLKKINFVLYLWLIRF